MKIKKIKKVLDTLSNKCYNIREEKRDSHSQTSKKIKKVLDNLIKRCYNKRVVRNYTTQKFFNTERKLRLWKRK